MNPPISGIRFNELNADDFHIWSDPVRIDTVEYTNHIEIIYKETSIYQWSSNGPNPYLPPEERVFKIIFSCVNGKWNKSQRIYGKIIPAQLENYTF